MAHRPFTRWIQPFLFDEVVRDYREFNHDRPLPRETLWLDWARHLAHGRAEVRGWSHSTRNLVDRGLVIVLARYAEGETVYDSQIRPALRAINASVEHVAGILDLMEIFADDRAPAFETWLIRQLDGIAPGMKSTVEQWVRLMRSGGPRARPRSRHTVRAYLSDARPALLRWSQDCEHLREVTRDDVLAHLDSLHGHQRRRGLIALRALFTWAKRAGLIFRNPTSRIRVGKYEYGVLQPLTTEQITRTVQVAQAPATRLAVILAAVHAARPGAIRALQLDDIDLGDRRLTLAGNTRRMDDLTHCALLAYLEYRRKRWPNSPNLHLLINRKTAVNTSPVSDGWMKTTFRDQDAKLERLRIDRVLEEALVHGPDPLHLAEVFALDEKTAIRYANSARQLLERPVETDPACSP